MINVWTILPFVASAVCKLDTVGDFNKYRIFGNAIIDNMLNSTKMKSVVGCDQLDHTRSARIIAYDATRQLCQLYEENTFPLMISPAPSTPRTLYVKGTIYSVVQIPMTWMDAKLNCEVDGGQLITIESAEKNELVTSLLRMYKEHDPSTGISPWIGLNDLANESQYLWADDSLLGDYENWEPGEPNNYGGQDCIRLVVPHNHWSDRDCLNIAKSLCEYN